MNDVFGDESSNSSPSSCKKHENKRKQYPCGVVLGIFTNGKSDGSWRMVLQSGLHLLDLAGDSGPSLEPSWFACSFSVLAAAPET
jgi:hypothetical protein